MLIIKNCKTQLRYFSIECGYLFEMFTFSSSFYQFHDIKRQRYLQICIFKKKSLKLNKKLLFGFYCTKNNLGTFFPASITHIIKSE